MYTTFKWRKLGLIYAPDTTLYWSRHSAMLPTPICLNDQVIRVFYSSCDVDGRGRISFVDLDAQDPTHILYRHNKPILDIGKPGMFDDNGVVCVGMTTMGTTYYMYYVGFELFKNVRYKMFTGLAVSTDCGKTFKKFSNTPVLDRGDTEYCFRCGPFVMNDNGLFRMWYVAGSNWEINNDGKSMPIYNLRYIESKDGKHWPSNGTVSMEITQPDEHGFGRPWVIKNDDGTYEMYYSIRRRSFKAYRLGYAISTDGLNWNRKDDKMGLDISPTGFDSKAIMYSAVITVSGRTYCFYNGNNFGYDGFAVARRED